MYLKKTVAAIIPLANAKNSIFEVIQGLDATGYTDEIIIVNVGADEETLKKVAKTRARIINKENAGVGEAIKIGIKNTKADLIIVTEPSGTFKGKDISKLLAYSEDFDTVFGSRTHVPLVSKDSGMTLPRRLVDNFFGRLIVIFFLSSNLTDVGCTFRLTNRKAWLKVAKDCNSKSEMFLTQWLIAAAKNKVRFIEVPINFTAPNQSVGGENFFYLTVRAIVIFYQIIKMWILNLLR